MGDLYTVICEGCGVVLLGVTVKETQNHLALDCPEPLANAFVSDEEINR